MDKEEIYRLLTKEIPLENIKQNEPMNKHTSFKIGGNADFFVIAKNENTLKNVLKIVKEHKIPLTILGNGSNVLVKDNGIRGIVVKIDFDEINFIKASNKKNAEKEKNLKNAENNLLKINNSENSIEIELGSGVKLAMLAQVLLEKEITGFEFASGIPGTIGGAVFMNAGAYGKEMKDIVTEVTYMDYNSNLHTISNKECEFDYRTSLFAKQQNNNNFTSQENIINNQICIITKVKIKLQYGNKKEIKSKMDEYAESRKEKQPIQMPSAGSTFKRGNDFITAKLIDECGLKGFKIGGAQVSNLHAGFIVNTGNATAEDVIQLINYVQSKVYEKFGKQIEPEIKIIGE